MDRITVKNNLFFQPGQTGPKFKFFFLKKPVLTPYKPSQALRSEAMDQTIPRNEKTVPFGPVFKAEKIGKIRRKHNSNFYYSLDSFKSSLRCVQQSIGHHYRVCPFTCRPAGALYLVRYAFYTPVAPLGLLFCCTNIFL